ncbi:MAG: FecR domain-containing protein [Vulcanimicrobiaceae bacterium]
MMLPLRRIALIASFAGTAGLCTTTFSLADSQRILLERVDGAVEYLPQGVARPLPVAGRLVVRPEDYAITERRSMATLALPDSSLIAIGSATKVRVGSFSAEGGVSSMSVAIMGGALHFSIRHPQGGHANYIFTTPTTQIAIRGTEGMIVVRPGETIVACVHGTVNDTMVTTRDGRRISLPVGMTLTVQSAGRTRVRMSMLRGVSGPEFKQFASIVARNHAMRSKGSSR